MEDYRLHIRTKRKALGFSQKQLACAANVSQPFIHDIESQKKHPSMDVLARICEALNIEIVFRDIEETPANREEAE